MVYSVGFEPGTGLGENSGDRRLFFILHLIGAALVGVIVGFVASRMNLVRTPVPSAMIIGLGGGVAAFFVFSFFGIGLFGRSGTAAIGAGIALYLARGR